MRPADDRRRHEEDRRRPGAEGDRGRSGGDRDGRDRTQDAGTSRDPARYRDERKGRDAREPPPDRYVRDKRGRDDRDRDDRQNDRASRRDERAGGYNRGGGSRRTPPDGRADSGRLPPPPPPALGGSRGLLGPLGGSSGLIAEAAKVLQEQRAAEAAAQARGGGANGAGGHSSGSELEEGEALPEEGELPLPGPPPQRPQPLQSAPATAPSGNESDEPGRGKRKHTPIPAPGASSGEGDANARGKRKHAPIVWHTPPKAPKAAAGASAGGAAAQSKTELPSRLSPSPTSSKLLAGSMHPSAVAAGGGVDLVPHSGGADPGGATPTLTPGAGVRSALSSGSRPAPLSGSSGGEGDDEGGGTRGGGTRSVTRSGSEDEGGGTERRGKSGISSRWLALEAADSEADAEAHARGEGEGVEMGPQPVASTAAGPAGAGEEGGELDGDVQQAAREQGGVEEEEEEEVPAVAQPLSMLSECRSVFEFQRLNRISEGTYGVVYRALDKGTGRICALKKVKMDKERDGFPMTSIREINILLSLQHPTIVNVSEVVVGPSLDEIFMVMEYMEHDLKALQDTMSAPFTVSEVKCLMLQLLDGVAYMHDNWVIHRDLKTSNLLYNSKGELKICDFGLARQFGSPLRPYTHMVVTLWYRPPELLLGAKTYSTAVDVWSVGCIMAEWLTNKVLFDGKSELDQMDKIFRCLGPPSEAVWPGFSKLPNAQKLSFKAYGTGGTSQLREHFPAPSALGLDAGKATLTEAGFDLLSRLLALCPDRRISAREALAHPWFRERPLPKERAMMPTWPGRAEKAAMTRRALAASPRK